MSERSDKPPLSDNLLIGLPDRTCDLALPAALG